ncbi:MAG: sigma-E processing peptidase SpoIIGA [Faecousia sp.]
MTVYLDLVVILNFLVDFLLLLGTNRLAGFPLAAKRCALAATLGAVYAAGCMVPTLRFLGNALWRTVSLVLMAVIAFGCSRSAVKRGGVFVLLSMALGGIALSFGRGNVLSLVLCAGGIWLLCRVAFGETVGGREYIPVTLTYGDNTVSLTALKDSGNTLRDPITGEQVLVIAGDVARKLTGLSQEDLRYPLETLARRPIPGLRLIPYHSVGNRCGMLLGLRFENVKFGSRTQSAVVAFAPEGLGRGEVYQALTGGAL